MRTRFGQLAAALTALALLLITGCGGGGKTGAYIDGFNETQDSFQASLEGANFTDLTREDAPEVLERTAAAADEAARDLDGLDPPEAVRAHNREMVALLQEIRDLAREARRVLEGEIDEAAVEILAAVGEQLTEAGNDAEELTGEIAAELGTDVAE